MQESTNIFHIIPQLLQDRKAALSIKILEHSAKSYGLDTADVRRDIERIKLLCFEQRDWDNGVRLIAVVAKRLSDELVRARQ